MKHSSLLGPFTKIPFTTYEWAQLARVLVIESFSRLVQCNTPAYWIHSLLTYEWAELAKVSVPGKPLQHSVMQQFSLLSLFVSYKENEVLLIQLFGPYSQHIIFFIAYECAELSTAFVPSKPFQLSVMKHSSLLGSLNKNQYSSQLMNGSN
jgi:hypothetical protein